MVEWREPAGPGIRVDGWITSQTRVSQYYDNLMAKLVVWGKDREQAIARGRRALEEFVVKGVHTTIPAHKAVLSESAFLEGRHHTKWMEESVVLEEETPLAPPAVPEDLQLQERSMTVEIGGRRFSVTFWAPEPQTAGGAVRRQRPKLEASQPTSSDGVVTAPMQGTIVKVHVRAGETVDIGDPICVLEAMKMENEVKSPAAGAVVDLRVEPGDTVSNGAVIAIVK